MVLPLDTMIREEKLQAMEALWADLSRDENHFESPGWHGVVLEDRDRRLRSGEEKPMDWETAKRQLRKQRE